MEDMEGMARLADLILRNRVGTVLYRYFNTEVRVCAWGGAPPAPWGLCRHLLSGGWKRWGGCSLLFLPAPWRR